MAINTFASFPKSTPTAALEVMLDVMPLHLFCQREGTAARIRLKEVIGRDWEGTCDRKTHAISHMRHWDNVLEQYKINLSNTDACSLVKWNAGFHINRDSFDGKAMHRGLTQYNVYTDGSRKSEQSGAGYVIYKHRHEIASASFRLPDHATVFQAEIVAVKKAAEHLLTLTEHDIRFVKIFIDSQAAILALANPIIKSKTVADTIDVLNALTSRTLRTTITWIPAHKGYFGNSRADDLAKSGSESTDLRCHVTVAKPASTTKQEIALGTHRAWDQEWKSDDQYVHTKFFYGGPDKHKARFVYKLARLELGRFIRLITGHNNLNWFQTRIGLWDSGTCRFCEDQDETFVHIASECPRFWESRRQILGGDPPNNAMEWSVRALIDLTYLPGLNAAFEGTWSHGDPLGIDDLDSLPDNSHSTNDSSSDGD